MTSETTTKICSSIAETVSRIENELKTIDNKGIFFAPELHIAFECAKDIVVSGQNIWGNEPINGKEKLNLKITDFHHAKHGLLIIRKRYFTRPQFGKFNNSIWL